MNWKQTTNILPDMHQLKERISQPLAYRFPLNAASFASIRSACNDTSFLNFLCQVSDESHSTLFAAKFLLNAVYPPPVGDTKESFHSFWDTFISNVITFTATANNTSLAYNRNSRQDASVFGLQRPNLTITVDKFCVFRGQEIGPSSNGNPKEELSSKLDWSFKEVPYVLAYYARAYNVTLCAIYNYQKVVHVYDLMSFDLTFVDHRLALITALFHIAPLLKMIAQLCVKVGAIEDEDFERTTKTVRLQGNFVKKTYKTMDTYSKVLGLYRQLGQMDPPKFEQIFSSNMEHRSITFLPRVVQRQPITIRGLLKSLVCILETLQIIHAKGIYHRDIRWVNVGRSRDDKSEEDTQWFLIDFDEAVGISQLGPESHAPETNHQRGPSVDIWSIGYLLKTSIVTVPDELRVIQQSCLEVNPTLRPGVDVLLAQIKSMALCL
ncbi:hypothetical protein BDR26DRAFT_2967 [Obelidium mucronatum]|nr:hypothetical protein BDR26DRAFT_2967 [Obelidium mucronatum]